MTRGSEVVARDGMRGKKKKMYHSIVFIFKYTFFRYYSHLLTIGPVNVLSFQSHLNMFFLFS